MYSVNNAETSQMHSILFVVFFMYFQGDDSVVECVHDGTSSNSVNAYMSWNSGKSNRRLKVRNGQMLYVY
jgi:hypothetical protein